jgi:hypothetical protein
VAHDTEVAEPGGSTSVGWDHEGAAFATAGATAGVSAAAMLAAIAAANNLALKLRPSLASRQLPELTPR